jgi:hypothetical protein
VNDIRQRFWIPDIRVAVKHAKKCCQICKIKNSKPVIPEMAPLPDDRLASNEAPFSHVGLDFFGPIEVCVGRRKEKRWGALFTCLVIRAVHIELVYSMDTSSCILAIRNFSTRYGTPKVIRCDRGTNLRGAERELVEALSKIDTNQLQVGSQDYIPGDCRIKFMFNPPAAPHMGGALERLIQSVKKILKVMLKERTPKEETLRNFLNEAADIVNSRPLTYRAIDPDEQETITPNHLLRLSTKINIAPGEFDDDSVCKKQWRVAQNMADQFWRRWTLEYLPEITRRSKWFDSGREICVDDLVLIVDSNAPRNQWRRGRVIETVVGKDNHIRSAKLKTSTGILMRPVSKLAVLEVKKNQEDDSKNLVES